MTGRLGALEALASDPPKSGLVLDFDGVLSPIVEDPATSKMPDYVAGVLARIAEPLGLLAVMSGRPVEFLEDRVRIPGIPLLGSYGIERSVDGVRQLDQGARSWLGKIHEAREQAFELLGQSPGIRLEEKSVSVAIHWRQAPDRSAAADEVGRVARRIAAELGLRLEPGKFVQELRPPTDVDKGSAISALLAGRNLAVTAYVGDDVGDIPALRAVRDRDVVVGGYALVVDHGAETDPLLLGLADETFAGTEEFACWLGSLAQALGV